MLRYTCGAANYRPIRMFRFGDRKVNDAEPQRMILDHAETLNPFFLLTPALLLAGDLNFQI